MTSRTCTVPGYSKLTAGILTLQTTDKTPITIQPQVQPDGVIYQQTLPAGFVQPGHYTVTSATGAPVSFSSAFSMGLPIQIQTNLSPGTVISSNHGGFTIRWTGGDSGALVRVKMVAPFPNGGSVFNTYWATTESGSLTIDPFCSGSNPLFRMCTWLLPLTDNGQIIMDVFPPNVIAAAASAQGLTDSVQVYGIYRYVFEGLSLTN